MSYARFGVSGSDVYVFLTSDPSRALVCKSCRLYPGLDVRTWTTRAMLEHLVRHQDMGHHVPVATTDALLADAEVNDAWMGVPS